MALEVKIKKNCTTFMLDVDFLFTQGILGILGASGCGKSMTLKCIAGIVTPDEGKIILNGRTLFDSKQGINLPPQQRNIGYLFQNYALFPHMNVEQNIMTGIKVKHKQEIVNKYIRIFYLENLKKHYPRNLSGGQQQRVALARIFASEPEILMLDEPFSALDDFLKWQVELELAKILKMYPKDILFVSHNRDEIYRFCDEVAVLSKGKIVSFSEKKSLFEMPKTIEASKLSGCKNHSTIKRLDDDTIKAMDWDIELSLHDKVDESDKYVGIRAHEILQTADRNNKNTYEFIIENIIENIFSVIIMVKISKAKAMLRVEISKEQWDNKKQIGDKILLTIPKEKIFTLK